MKAKTDGIMGRLSRFEPFYFYFFVLLNLLPVLGFRYFPTADGPAHLYNSRIIVDLLQHADSPLHAFYAFNSGINPNWSGHFLLSIFLTVFPGYMAEKLFMLIYLLGLPLGFRFLFRSLSIRHVYLLYLIFPFTYSYLFFYGFYNFNLGLVFLFFGTGFWIKYKDNLTLSRCILLFAFSSLICLSHVFVFIIFLLVIGILNLQSILSGEARKKTGHTFPIKSILLQLICLSFGLTLIVKYLFFSGNTGSSATYIPFQKILQSLLDAMPAKGINYGKAGNFTKWITYVLGGLVVYILVAKISRWKHYSIEKKAWLWIILSVAVLLFVMPDGTHVAGFITTRLVLFFFLFLMVWTAAQNVPGWLRGVCFLIINYIGISLIIHNYTSIKKYSTQAKEIEEAAKKIDPYSVVLPVTHSAQFAHGHISNYLGVDKPLVVLENYEALLDYFPLKWNYEKTPRLFIDPVILDHPCPEKARLEQQGTFIEYVFILNDKETLWEPACEQGFLQYLELNNYQEVYSAEEGEIKLYKKIPTSL